MQGLPLERTTVPNWYMLPSRSLAITWADNPEFWRWISESESGYDDCAELLSVYSLVVSRVISPKELPLPAATRYTVYLVYKLAPSTSGLRGSEQTSKIKLYGERVVATSRVSLHPPSGSRIDDVTYPEGRGNGWLTLRLGEFDNEKTVIVELRQENAHIKKSGLIVAGMEVRSHDAEANASDDLKQSTPQLTTEISSEGPSSSERTTIGSCYMLPLRSLTIAWGDDPQFWRWVSDYDSRYDECAELLSVYSLVVSRQIVPNDLPLPAATLYTVYLVYKLAPSTSGLRGSEQMSKIKLYGERVIATSRVSLHPHGGSGTVGVTYPVLRDDGWLELWLGEFDNKKTVIVELREENAHIKKSGLIIAGMEVRSNDARTN